MLSPRSSRASFEGTPVGQQSHALRSMRPLPDYAAEASIGAPSSYSSPPTNLRHYDRLTQVAERQGVVFGRLQRHKQHDRPHKLRGHVTDDTGARCCQGQRRIVAELRREFRLRTSKDFTSYCRDIELIHEQRR